MSASVASGRGSEACRVSMRGQWRFLSVPKGLSGLSFTAGGALGPGFFKNQHFQHWDPKNAQCHSGKGAAGFLGSRPQLSPLLPQIRSFSCCFLSAHHFLTSLFLICCPCAFFFSLSPSRLPLLILRVICMS